MVTVMLLVENVQPGEVTSQAHPENPHSDILWRWMDPLFPAFLWKVLLRDTGMGFLEG